MDGNGMDAEAGRIDVVSCGIGFPEDAETLGLIGRADVVYGSRALLAACPVEARLTRIIGAKAREDAADALTLCRAGRHVVVLASGDALYHGFGGTLSGMAHPDDAIVYHPGITAFQALFHRLGLPWQDARLFSAHSGEALPARAIAEAPLSVAYAGSRYPAHAIAQAVLKLHPSSAGAPPSSPNGSAPQKNASFQARWRIWPARNAAPRPSCFCSRTFGTVFLIPSPGLLTMRVPIPAFTAIPPYPTASPRRYSPLGSRKKTMNARTT